jgi:4'-phosphopantetheinyl transferase EntD
MTAADLARALFGPDIALAAADPGADGPPALPAEAAAMARMVPARRREFAAGRDAARRAMVALGLPPVAVPMGDDRAPVWPAGVIGAISHGGGACLAAVARAGKVRGLGLDLEPDADLDPDLIASICTPAERAGLPATGAGRAARLIFSAKECAYKCQYGASRTLFGFDTLEITLDPAAGRFAAVFAADVPPFARDTVLPGRFAIGAGLIVTAMTLGA